MTGEHEVGPPIIITEAPARESWRWQLVTFARQLVVAVVTSAVIIAGLVIGFAGRTGEEVQRQEDTLHANLAVACVLSLPVDPVSGRDGAAVKTCFTQYDLQPPMLHG